MKTERESVPTNYRNFQTVHISNINERAPKVTRVQLVQLLKKKKKNPKQTTHSNKQADEITSPSSLSRSTA